MSQVDFYAWAVPAFVSGTPFDHTWVTTYDNRSLPYPDLATFATDHGDYWYCWGDFHAKGGTPKLLDGLIGRPSGDLNFARCLVTSNVRSNRAFSARGTIFTYGIDGVCHQLANQVLFATSTLKSAPLTVRGVRGYLASLAIYGTHGLQAAAWRAKYASCRSLGLPARPSPDPGIQTMDKPQDEFGRHVYDVLGADDPDAAAHLLAIRSQFQNAAAADAHRMSALSAEQLNARNQRFLDEATTLLGPDRFEEVFGISAGETINLVLPDPTTDERHPTSGLPFRTVP